MDRIYNSADDCNVVADDLDGVKVDADVLMIEMVQTVMQILYMILMVKWWFSSSSSVKASLGHPLVLFCRLFMNGFRIITISFVVWYCGDFKVPISTMQVNYPTNCTPYCSTNFPLNVYPSAPPNALPSALTTVFLLPHPLHYILLHLLPHSL